VAQETKFGLKLGGMSTHGIDWPAY